MNPGKINQLHKKITFAFSVFTRKVATVFPWLIPVGKKILNNRFFLRNRTIKRNYPAIVNIELTNYCNARCHYCGREELIKKKVRPILHMNFQLLEKIVYDISQLPIPPKKIIPVGLGDPLLYDRITDAIKLIKKHLPDIEIQITTNGIHLPETLQKELIDSGLDTLLISMNFFDKESYFENNGVNQFEKVLANATSFLALKKNRKPHTAIQLMDVPSNKKIIEKFYKYWQNRLSPKDYIYLRKLDDFCGTIDIENYGIKKQKSSRYPCAQIYDNIMINVEGDCFPCCMGINTNSKSNLCIGNINKTSMSDIFMPDTRIFKIRELHEKNMVSQIDLCPKCDTWHNLPNLFYWKKDHWA